MEQNFKRCLDFTLALEGHPTDDARDPGGPTALGITQATLSTWRGHAVTREDVFALTKAEAMEIYHASYWLATWCDAMPAGLDMLMFDMAVNPPGAPPLRLLAAQTGIVLPWRARGHRQPGSWSAQLAFLAGQCMPGVIVGLCEQRATLYRSRPGFPAYGRGWLNRVEAVQRRSMHIWVTNGTAIPDPAGSVA